jgi:hypothetical protein
VDWANGSVIVWIIYMRGIQKVKIQWQEKMFKAFYFDDDLRYP